MFPAEVLPYLPVSQQDSPPERVDLPLARLRPNPLCRFSLGEDTFLRASMLEEGCLEAVLVTPDAQRAYYRIVNGHRRVQVARRLGQDSIACRICHYPDTLSELKALLGANLHQRQIKPFEMARQLEVLREVLWQSGLLPEGMKAQALALAEHAKLSRATVERYLDLLRLNQTLTVWAEQGKMSMTDAYELARKKHLPLQAVVEHWVLATGKPPTPRLLHQAILRAKGASSPQRSPSSSYTLLALERSLQKQSLRLQQLDCTPASEAQLRACLLQVEQLQGLLSRAVEQCSG